MEIKKELQRAENEKNKAISRGDIERDNGGELKCGLSKTTILHWKQHIKCEKHIKEQLNDWMQDTRPLKIRFLN